MQDAATGKGLPPSQDILAYALSCVAAKSGAKLLWEVRRQLYPPTTARDITVTLETLLRSFQSGRIPASQTLQSLRFHTHETRPGD